MRYLDKIFTEDQIKKETYVYAQNPDGGELILDGYHPTNDEEKMRPCVFWLYSGGGSRDSKQSLSWCMEFAMRGYVVVPIDYRNDTGEKFTEEDQKLAVTDLDAAIRWARMNATKLGIDPDKIFSGGNSAGGLTALQANISSFNLDDKYFIDDPRSNTANPGLPSNVIGSATVSGGAATTIFKNFINEKNAPNYAYVGELDDKFPPEKVKSTCEKMNEVGVPSTYVVYPGVGHKIEHFDEIVADIISKLYKLI